MAEDVTTGGPDSGEGQASEGSEATTQDAPATGEGQPSADSAQRATGTGPDATAEDTFFDPADIQDRPELMAAYKGMQKAFTKKMQAIKEGQQKIDAYDAFNVDPVGNLQRLAAGMGYRLSRAEAANALQQQSLQQNPNPNDPQTWDDVYSVAEQRAFNRFRQEFAPVLERVGELQKTAVEKILDETAPDWREYEDQMITNLRLYPNMVKDPAKLYQISVPPEVLESRAAKKAMKKLQEKASGTTTGASTTKGKPLGEMPEKPVTFQEAVEIARANLRERGITLG